MGTGRKNQNYSHDGHNAQGGGRPQPPPHMNLGDELGGVIFGATSHTLEGEQRITFRTRHDCVLVAYQKERQVHESEFAMMVPLHEVCNWRIE